MTTDGTDGRRTETALPSDRERVRAWFASWHPAGNLVSDAECAPILRLLTEVRRESHANGLEACERICRERAAEYDRAGYLKEASAALACGDEISEFENMFRRSGEPSNKTSAGGENPADDTQRKESTSMRASGEKPCSVEGREPRVAESRPVDPSSFQKVDVTESALAGRAGTSAHRTPYRQCPDCKAYCDCSRPAEPRPCSPGDERELIDGIHKGVVVRLRERAEVSEIGVQMWRVDWPGARPLVVREDFLGQLRTAEAETQRTCVLCPNPTRSRISSFCSEKCYRAYQRVEPRRERATPQDGTSCGWCWRVLPEHETGCEAVELAALREIAEAADLATEAYADNSPLQAKYLIRLAARVGEWRKSQRSANARNGGGT